MAGLLSIMQINLCIVGANLSVSIHKRMVCPKKEESTI